MTFGEKLKHARLSRDLSQEHLAQLTGISPRSIYTYEKYDTLPRKGNLLKIAKALNISEEYLISPQDYTLPASAGSMAFLAKVKVQYGNKGEQEALEILNKTSALFAGSELKDEAKDIFFQSLMTIYLESKEATSEKFNSRKRASKRRKDSVG